MPSTPKRLGKGTWTAGGTTLAYTAPANTQTIITSIRIVGTTGTGGPASAYLGGTAQADKISGSFMRSTADGADRQVTELLALGSDTASTTSQAAAPRHPVVLNAGDTLYVGGSQAGGFTVFGIEVS